MRLKLQHSARRRKCAHPIVLPLAVVLTALLSPPCSGQDVEPVARPFLDTGGPQAHISQLRFSPDATKLMAAGHDKRVFVWDLILNPIDASLKTARPIEPVFWPQSRSVRGIISGFDITSDSRHLAMAGASAFGHYGDIAIYDLARREIRLTLPQMRPPQPDPTTGHVVNVLAVQFSPDRRWLVSSDSDGVHIVWNMEKATLHRRILTKTRQVPQLAFIDSKRFVYLDTPLDGPREILLCDVSIDAPPQNLTRGKQPSTLALTAAGGNGHWVSSDTSGGVHLWNGPELLRSSRLSGQRLQPEGKQPAQMRVAMSLAYGRGRSLLVNVLRQVIPDGGQSRAELELWDLIRLAPKHPDDFVEIAPCGGFGRTAMTAAISGSPSGVLAAGVDEINNAIHVFEIDDAGRFRRDERGEPTRTVLQGTGLPVWAVEFAADMPLRLRVPGVPGGPAQRLIELDPPAIHDRVPADAKWLDSQASTDGWTVKFGRSQDQGQITNTAEFTTQTSEKFKLSWDASLRGEWNSHAWIADQDGPFAMAIGTHSGSVFVTGLRGPYRGSTLRYFRGHNDRVNDLSVSPDGRILASASSDTTVRFWNLASLKDRPEVFPDASAWGATFELMGAPARLVVRNVRDGGIASARGFRDGDLVQRYEHTLGDLQTSNKTQVEVAPANILAAIKQTNLWDQADVHVTRQRDDNKPEPKRIVLVPGWEPIASAFINIKGEWGLWTPQGFYDCSVHGDRLFGWISNPRTRTGTPKVARGSNIREFDQPEKLRDLFRDPTLPPIQFDPPNARVNPPEPVLQATIHALPKLTLVSPLRIHTEKHAQPFQIEVDVEYEDADHKPHFEVTGYLNTAPLEPRITNDVNAHTTRYQWHIDPAAIPASIPNTDDSHQFSVRTRRVGEDIGKANGQDLHLPFRVVHQKPYRKPRLHYVGIAVNDYSGAGQTSLNCPVEDIKGIEELVTSASDDGFFERGLMITRTEKQVTWGAIKELADNLYTHLKPYDVEPNDLMIIAISGHGLMSGNSPRNYQYSYVGSSGNIPWSELRRLADVPCRRLVLLDTCHSGAAVDEQRQDASQNNQQPGASRKWNNQADHNSAKIMNHGFEAGLCAVFSAARPEQLAWESSPYSIFTMNFIGGTQGGDADRQTFSDRNRIVTLEEAVKYTEQQVPFRAAQITGRDGQPVQQTPYITPGLSDFVLRFPLIKAR